MEEKPQKEMLFVAFLATLLIKLALTFAIPITSDEALFVLWGKYLDFGYYDHPPMVGWILHLFGYMGNAAFLMRLPAVLFTLFIGYGIYHVLKGYDHKKATLVAILFLVSPINILNVLITTDTPLILFAFLSCVSLYKALNTDALGYYLLSGAFLGAAFLSKYFAVLLGLAYAAYFLFSPMNKRKTLGFILLFVTVVPFVALNIYWNYTHCWANVMFNVFNRNREEHYSLAKVLAFLLSQAYLITPPVVYYLYKRRKERLLDALKAGRFTLFAVAFAVPVAVMAVMSPKKMIGLHWLLAFYPFMYISVVPLLDETQLLKSIKFMTLFTLVHLFLVGTILSLPLSALKHNKNYSAIVMGTRPAELLRQLQQYERDFFFATPSYADSAVLSFHSGKYFSVFGGGSHHGRQDDLLTDFRQMNGRNIVIVKGSKPDMKEYEPLFRSVELKEISVHGAPLYLVIGYGFNYEEYRERILRPIKEKYYTIPPFLPMPASSCYFFNKYFPE